jgi:peptidoglycan/xylan/chitin deacetylase (PgdA/CDA1 family)/lysophospholipase L1-like esterase
MKKLYIYLVLLLLIVSTKLFSQNLLNNPGFEDNSFDNHWIKSKLSGSDGTMQKAGYEQANNGVEACQMTTILSNTNFGKFGLKSVDYPTNSTNFSVSVMAKTDATGVENNIGFKIQIAANTTEGTTKYFVSSEQKLSDLYQDFTFTKDATSLGLDFTSVRVVFQCAGYLGNYFFDDAVLNDGSEADTSSMVIVPVEVTPITSINTAEKVVAFTFDDGPDSVLSTQIADLFESYNGTATFFNNGKKLAGKEAVVKQLLNKGHEVGNHTMTHSRLPDFENDEDIFHDIVDFQDLYQSKFEYSPILFRAPFLDYGQVRTGDNITPDKDDRVGGVLTMKNLKAINASIYSKDASSATTASDIINRLQGNINPGDIILCHEKEHTLEALESIIPELASAGYSFVTVSELIRIEQGWKSIAPSDSNIVVYGCNYISDKNNERILHRHSDEVYNGTTKDNLFNPLKARSGSGIVLKFKTASPKINARFRILEGNAASSIFGIYQNNILTNTSTFEYVSNQEIVIEIKSVNPGTEQEYAITLPIWTDVSFLGLELETGYELSVLKKEQKPVYVAYGNSITHGRGQNGAFETYPFIVSQNYEWELYNLAVGGGKTSQVMANMIRDDFKHIDYMTVLIGYNDYNGEGIDTATYRDRYKSFIDTVRKKHKNTKIFCITLTYTSNHESVTSGVPADDFRTVTANIVNERIIAGDSNIYLIRGEDISSEENLREGDAVHFSIQGANNFADELFLALQTIIVDNSLTGSEASILTPDSKIFPNPTVDSITIKGVDKNTMVYISDVSGKIIGSYRNLNAEHEINISYIKPGVYYISLQSNDKRITEKLIKI